MLNKIIGKNPKIVQIIEDIEKIAQSKSSVLLLGENGTGKELFARHIHQCSSRARGPWVEVRCGAVPTDFLEAELFGYVKDAFAGATQVRKGQLEMAHGGTIFLDEIGELPLHLQVKLLRVLQGHVFEPVGASDAVCVDVRIIAATSHNLKESIQKGKFREDLYYRLNVIPISIPPIRERKEDIPLLVNYFIEKYNRILNVKVEAPEMQVVEVFKKYDWPGNVEELENLVERLVIFKREGSIELGDLPHFLFRKFVQSQPQALGAVSEWDFPKMVLPKNGLHLKTVVAAFENHLVDQALERTQGNKNKASELLKMNRTTLVEKLRKRGMIQPLRSKKERSIDHLESV